MIRTLILLGCLAVGGCTRNDAPTVNAADGSTCADKAVSIQNRSSSIGSCYDERVCWTPRHLATGVECFLADRPKP